MEQSSAFGVAKNDEWDPGVDQLGRAIIFLDKLLEIGELD